MAVLTSGTLRPLDFRLSDVSTYAYLNITVQRTDYFSGDYRALGVLDQRAEFFGTGFSYNSLGSPISGTVTGLRETYAGQLIGSYSGLSLPMPLFNFWIANGLTEEGQSYLLAGDDNISSTYFDDYVRGYTGNDRLELGAGDDEAFGGPGNDVLFGGPGLDTVWLAGTSAEYSQVVWGNVAAAVPRTGAALAAEGVDKVYDVEQFRFEGSFTTAAVGATNFFPLNYIASHADLSTYLGANPAGGFDHYIYAGVYEGRSTTFSGFEYLASHADLLAAFGVDGDAAAAHYIRFGRAEGREVNFDGLRYIASHADLVAAFGQDANAGAWHYLTAGQQEGRTITFNPLEYTASYGDLIAAFATDEGAALSHYIARGIAEGRRVSFDGLQYVASHDDLIGALGPDEHAGALHYIGHGLREGRAVDRFNEVQYLANYPDLQAAFGTDARAATAHYVRYGSAEGRSDDGSSAALDFAL